MNKRIRNNSSGTVIHIRAGDTVKNATKQWTKAIPHSKSNLKIYVFDRSYYKKIINQSRINHDAPLTIIASTIHILDYTRKNMNTYHKFYEENMKYITYVSDLFVKSMFNVTLRINQGTPDEDFLFMSRATTFIQGGGGYSNLIGNIVKKRNHIVITKKPDKSGLA